MRDLRAVKASIRGQVIADMHELRTLAEAVPEGGGDLPEPVTRLVGGEEVEPGELYRALDDARSVVDADEGLIMIDAIRHRLEQLFPGELA